MNEKSRKFVSISALIAAALTTSSCMGASAEAESRADPADAFAGKKKIGEPETCIRTSNISSTNVVSGRIIDFNMSGSKVYRSVLPAQCPGLSFQEAISYDASYGQLCRNELIRVVDNFGGRLDLAAACNLGSFQQIEDADEE